MNEAKEVTVHNNDIIISSNKFTPLDFKNTVYSSRDASLFSVAIKADNWTGIYKDYDLVSSLWPIVPPALFDHS